MYYKDGDITYGIQVTRSTRKRTVTDGDLDGLLSHLNVAQNSFVYVFCPGPSLWKTKLDKPDNNLLSLKSGVAVEFWRLESDYNY